MKKDKGRNGIIDIARLVFCLLIVVNHYNSVRPKGFEHYVMAYAFLGVEFFFIVSGYLMTANAESAAQNKGMDIGILTTDFLFRKFLKIFPVYIAAQLFSLVVEKIGKEITISSLFADFLLSIPTILQLQMAGIPCKQTNGPTWYLSAMFISMLALYPISVKYRHTFRRVIAPLLAMFIYGYLAAKVGNLATIVALENGTLYSGILRAVAGLSLGAICYECAERIHVSAGGGQLLLTVIELGSYLGAILLMNNYKMFRPDFIIVIFLATAITVSFSKKSYSVKLSGRVPSWVSKASLTIYLANAPAQYITKIFFTNKGAVEHLFEVYFMICIAAGLMLMLIEQLITINSLKKKVKVQ